MRAFNLLPVRPRNLELCLVGGYSDQEQYDRIVEVAKTSRFPVLVHGRVSQDDLVLAYNMSHVFVLPSFFEGLPLVTVEALASGCRAVVTELPGVRPWLEASLPGAPVAFVAPRPSSAPIRPSKRTCRRSNSAWPTRWADQLREAAKHPLHGTGFDTTAVSWDSLAVRMVNLLY